MTIFNRKMLPKGHGQSRRHQKADELPETMPGHKEDIAINYDFFYQPRPVTPSYPESTGLGELVPSFYDNGGVQELRLETVVDSFSDQSYDRVFEEFIDLKEDSTVSNSNEETSGADKTIPSPIRARPGAPLQCDLTAISNGISKALVPGLSKDHAANRDHENLPGTSNLSLVVKVPGSKASWKDPNPSLTLDGHAASSQAIPAESTSWPGDTSPPASEYVSLADVAGFVPGFERTTRQTASCASTSKKTDRRRRPSSLIELTPQPPKFLKGNHGKIFNKESITSPSEIQSSSSGRPVNIALSTSSAVASKLSQDGSSGTKYRCHECHKTFRDNHNLKEHTSKHTGSKAIWCIFAGCNKATSRLRDMARHMLDKHSKGKAFKCTHCGKAYKRADGLKTHVKNKHS
ncbi:Zinc finger protein plag1 [Mortierella alpina]|nr:Zinc finger protein plag1 [Mortierella alpina]